MHQFLDCEITTILAALRYWQANIGDAEDKFQDFFKDTNSLSSQEIDSLCERINFESPAPNPFEISPYITYMVEMTIEEMAADSNLTEIAKESVQNCKDLSCLETYATECWQYDLYTPAKLSQDQKVIPYLSPSKVEAYLEWANENDELEKTIPTEDSFVAFCLAIAKESNGGARPL